MLLLDNLSIGYGGNHGGKRVVASGLNERLCRGELACLIGSNGVGKSTLLRTICGLQDALDGRVMVDGSDMSALSRQQRAARVSIVLTSVDRSLSLSAEEVVALGRSPYTNYWGRLTATDRVVVAQAMESVGIASLADRRMDTLSDGERQKVMIAKALAQQTPLILLDEPTAFLDFNSRIDILMLLRRLTRDGEKTILLSSHDLQICLWLSDKIWLLGDDGTLTADTPQMLAGDGALKDLISHSGITLDEETMTLRFVE